MKIVQKNLGGVCCGDEQEEENGRGTWQCLKQEQHACLDVEMPIACLVLRAVSCVNRKSRGGVAIKLTETLSAGLTSCSTDTPSACMEKGETQHGFVSGLG